MIRNKIRFLSDHSSLQWLGYVLTPVSTSLFKRFFWLATITACCVGSVIVLRGAMNLYSSDDAVSYSVETDYLDWDTPFPALTICEAYNPGAFNRTLLKLNIPKPLHPFALQVTYWSAKFCRACTTCDKDGTCDEDFLELVNRIRFKCTELLTDCWWDNKPFPCCERFLPITTEYGTCFSFNSYLNGNEDNMITVNRKTGLPTLVFTATQDIFIRIHSPDDMITVASDNILFQHCDQLPLVNDFDVTLKVEQTISDVSVQLLPTSNRDCLFKHERPTFAHLWPFSRYSYSACEMYCRAITQAEVCNCTHHFMPQIGDVPKCDIEGLACLTKAKKEQLSTEHYHCPMACEEVTYEAIHVSCPRIISKTGVTRGRMRLGSLPSLRVRRHAIRELLGLVVDIGGVIGVFFGASLLSFLEIIYILFLRRYP